MEEVNEKSKKKSMNVEKKRTVNCLIVNSSEFFPLERSRYIELTEKRSEICVIASEKQCRIFQKCEK